MTEGKRIAGNEPHFWQVGGNLINNFNLKMKIKLIVNNHEAIESQKCDIYLILVGKVLYMTITQNLFKVLKIRRIQCS